MSMLPFTAHRVLERPPIPSLGDIGAGGGTRKKPRIIPPENGWEPFTLYLVHVAVAGGNPIHEAYLETGFIDKNTLGNYSEVWQNSYESSYKVGHFVYIRAIKRLNSRER